MIKAYSCSGSALFEPTVGENGQVDFHKLDMIEPVTDGQLLATLEPADLGTAGIDVMGAEIRA